MEYTFERFKCAEEFAQSIDRERGPGSWTMSRRPDQIIEEDGETYRMRVYVVDVKETSV